MEKTPQLPRPTWISQFEQDTDISADQLWNTVADRTEWQLYDRQLVPQIHDDDLLYSSLCFIYAFC